MTCHLEGSIICKQSIDNSADSIPSVEGPEDHMIMIPIYSVKCWMIWSSRILRPYYVYVWSFRGTEKLVVRATSGYNQYYNPPRPWSMVHGPWLHAVRPGLRSMCVHCPCSACSPIHVNVASYSYWHIWIIIAPTPHFKNIYSVIIMSCLDFFLRERCGVRYWGRWLLSRHCCLFFAAPGFDYISYIFLKEKEYCLADHPLRSLPPPESRYGPYWPPSTKCLSGQALP